MKIFRSVREIDLPALATVYEEDLRWKVTRQNPDASEFYGQILREQLLSEELTDFFQLKDSFYAILCDGTAYRSALRCEPWKDGYLVESLETAPDRRRQGAATALLSAVRDYLGAPLYSHVARSNVPSIRVHEKCGFEKILDHAVLVDGSVSSRYVTLKWNRVGNSCPFDK